MRPLLALSLLLAAAVPAVAQPTAFCPYGQTCPNTPSVPFPVINPVQGLSNALTLPLGKPPAPPPPSVGYAPIATPPPMLPPNLQPR